MTKTVGGDAGPLQGPLGVASVGPHHVVIRDDVGGVAQAQLGDVFAQPVDDAPAGDDGIAAAGVVHGCGEVVRWWHWSIGHNGVAPFFRSV